MWLVAATPSKIIHQSLILQKNKGLFPVLYNFVDKKIIIFQYQVHEKVWWEYDKAKSMRKLKSSKGCWLKLVKSLMKRIVP